jgi:hypothetical protein
MTVKALNTRIYEKVKSRMDINMEFGPEISHPKNYISRGVRNGKLITGTSTDDNNIQYTYTEVRQNQLLKR